MFDLARTAMTNGLAFVKAFGRRGWTETLAAIGRGGIAS
jgi:hypothetical protein